jgi:hypothetical protein
MAETCGMSSTSRPGFPERFAKQQFSVRTYSRLPGLKVTRGHECGLNAKARKRVVQEVVEPP